MKKLNLVFLIFLVILILNLPSISAQEKDFCAVYFTGVGCPHCAKADPITLSDLPKEYSNLVIIEYEIYQESKNAPLLIDYNSKYNSGLGIPLIIFENEYISGDIPIIENLEEELKEGPSKCPLINKFTNFNNLDINSLPGKPKIWTNERILIKTDESTDNEILKDLLITKDISPLIENLDYKSIEPMEVPLSGKNIIFDNAIKINGWIFQWNGKPIEKSQCPSCPLPTEYSECINNTKTRTNYKCSAETNYECVEYTETQECNNAVTTKLTLPKLISLAAVDAVNPCALAVLTLMLIAILTYNPTKKKNVLLAGLAFTLSVFIMYLIYGLIIIKSFQVIQALTSIRLILYKILGIGAIILGFLNIKDFIKYKPGGLFTEMPLFMRPKLKKIISGITSPKGAFFVGLFVTVFLLPCTIGPYVIAGGILSALELIKTIPLLLLYNAIFVLPMLLITLIVYAGFAKVGDVSGWKDKNIKYLHLIAGIIMLALGMAMVLGLV